MSTNNYDDMPQRPEDPRDATIRELRAEVERLAGLLDWHAPRAGDPFHHTTSARALLARLAGGSDA